MTGDTPVDERYQELTADLAAAPVPRWLSATAAGLRADALSFRKYLLSGAAP